MPAQLIAARDSCVLSTMHPEVALVACFAAQGGRFLPAHCTIVLNR
jgi:hypothetical protein